VVCQILYIPRRSPDGHHFQTPFLVQVHVEACQDMGVGMVLQRGEPGEEFPLMVVVKESNYSHHFFPFLPGPGSLTERNRAA